MVATQNNTSLYLDLDLKEQATNIFQKYGMSLNEAFNLFLKKSIDNEGLPFETKIPNKETLEAMRDVESGNNYETINLEDLK